jgi:lysophospholipase L1-like esterase
MKGPDEERIFKTSAEGRTRLRQVLKTQIRFNLLNIGTNGGLWALHWKGTADDAAST